MKTVLLLNNTLKNCGVQQWGIRIGSILTPSSRYNILYRELHSELEYFELIRGTDPDIILYNYHIDIMPWLTRSTKYSGSKHVAIVHEGFSHLHDNVGFDAYIYVPNNIIIGAEWANRVFMVGRPLLEYRGNYRTNSIPTVGSFGFGFKHKQYPLIVRRVNEQFDEARIRFSIPYQFKADPNGLIAREEIRLCRLEMIKPGITLEITNDFLSEDDNLSFLAGNDINAFFYDNSKLDSSSGATDFALSVDRPIAITNSPMFKHITDIIGTAACIEYHSFQDIINRGTRVLAPLKNKWSNDGLLKEFEVILDGIC